MISRLPSIKKASAAIGERSLSPVDLVEFCLDRIRRFDSEVRAWVLVDESGARQDARLLAEHAKRGRTGPLHGIPIAIKDIVDVAGWPTKCGSPLRESHIAESDAEIVSRLKRAGAIILGKTVTTEFASFDPPPTCNPWNLERTPGGSSSGSAAAVAMEMCMAAVGTQTGGSIIRPASYCGVVGFKPTYGATSLDGIEPLSWHLDHAGPIARCVEDAAIMFQVMRQTSPDPEFHSLQANELPRLTRLTGFFDERSDHESRQVFEAAVRRLQAAGVAIDELSGPSPHWEEILVSHRCIMAVEAAAHHRVSFERDPNRFGVRIRGLIQEGFDSNAVDYSAALRHQKMVQAELSARIADQIWIMPSTTTAAPDRGTTGDPAFNSLWSFAGLPEITIPAGTAGGLPCGLQLVGPANSESKLLAAAAACEQLLEFQSVPAMIQALQSDTH